MRHYGVKPLLVFDGGLLPMKADQEAKRSRYKQHTNCFFILSFGCLILIMIIGDFPCFFRSRKENLERANEHELAGNSSAAYECYQKAVDISPSIAYDLIQVAQIYLQK